jgi:hypothetical protein
MQTSARETTARHQRDDVARLELLRSAHPRSRVFVRLADAYLATGEARRALEVAREGLLEHPGDAAGHAALSRALAALGFSEQAAHATRRAAELAGDGGGSAVGAGGDSGAEPVPAIAQDPVDDRMEDAAANPEPDSTTGSGAVRGQTPATASQQTAPTQRPAASREPPALLHGAGLELAELLAGLLAAGGGGSGPVRLRRRLAAAVAQELGLTPSQVEAVVLAALVQELGLAGEAGARLRRIGLPPETLSAVRERTAPWSGGRRRPAAGARILAVVNAFTAALPPRASPAAGAVEAAVERVLAESGTRFDPLVVYALARVLRGGAAGGPAASERPPLLLLGEDPVRCGKLMARLALLGHRVATAPDPERAVARLAAEPAAAVVVGPARRRAAEALIRRLRGDAAVGDIAIIAAGYDDLAARVALLDAGADACVPERAPAAELRATLAALLRRARSPDEEPVVPRAGKSGAGPATRVAGAWFPEQGRLEDFRPAWLCRVLEHAAIEATLHLESASGPGLVAVAGGRVCHAATLGLRGPAALRALMGWTTGSFRIAPGTGTERA